MAKPKLALIPAAQGSKFYSVLPSSGVGDFDFTRSGSATRINSQGLIETVGNGVSRLNYPMIDGKVVGCPHHILEPARTNLVTYSEDFSQSSWVKLGSGTGSTAIVTNDYAISPDGTQNASRLQCDLNGGLTSSGNQSLIYDSITGSGDTSAFIYVKSNTSSSQNFYLANSLNDRIIVLATTEWKKIELNWNASGNGRTLSIGTRGTTGSDDTLDLLIWGAQVEAGSYATSYIPTSGSTVQRAAETCNGSGNSEVFNDSEGVLMAEVSTKKNSQFKRISIHSGSYVNSIVFDFDNTNKLYGKVFVGGNLVVTILASGLNIENKNKLILKYKENDFALWVNGFKVGTDNNGITPTGLNNLAFDLSTGQPFYGSAKQVQYYDTALTDEELEYMTSYRSLNELVTELNLNTL